MLYPDIDPILIDLGFFQIYWYGITYLFAFGTFWLIGYYRIRNKHSAWNVTQLNDACFYMILGVVIGGRVGYALFYGWDQLSNDLLWVLRIWEGGMSFHGGMLGVITALLLWSRFKNMSFWGTVDTVAPLVPPGLGFGRLGNFINTELPGRITDSAFGVHFPCHSVTDFNFLCTTMYEGQARHVSSLYQAVVEGVVLFVILWLYSSKPRGVGRVSAAFLISYGALRFGTEFFRQPDADIGFVLFNWMSMGQLLCTGMIIAGIVLLLPVTSRYIGKDALS